jgi:putative polyketide hydroxylase
LTVALSFLSGSAGAPWREAASKAAAAVGIDLAAYRLGSGGDLIDLENSGPAKLGLSAEGAMLVRPDGFVAWRTAELPPDPDSKLMRVPSSVLCRR